MKSIQKIFFLLAIIASCHANGQRWKIYTDSAKAYIDLKNTDKALAFYFKAREELKMDSLLTNTYARACNSIANLYSELGQYEKAIPLHLEAKQIREKIFGKENVEYAHSCSNVAIDYLDLSQYDKAEPLLLEAKQIQEKVSGKKNPDYARACFSLAGLYSRIGQYDKAEPLYIELREIQEKLFGKEHPDYAAASNDLALLYYRVGKYNLAEPLYQEAIQIQQKISGKEDLEYGKYCNNLAVLYHTLGQYARAEPLYLGTMQILEKRSGKRNPDYATSCYNLANLYSEMGKYDKAMPLCLEAKQIRENLFGEKNPDYANACNSLADLYRNLGQYDKAEPLILEAIKILAAVAGRENSDYASTSFNAGLLYLDMQEYDKAEPLLLEAKQIREKVSGKQHPDYAGTCNSLGNLYENMGQYDKSEAQYLEAKQIFGEVLGKEHHEYASSCENLGILYADMWQFDKAEPLYLEAKQILGKVLGKEHPDYATACDNLALLYRNIGQYKKAELLDLEAKQIREKVLGKAHPEYASSCNNLALLYKTMGLYEKAEPLYLEAKEIREKLSGRQNSIYGLYCENLGELYWVMHQPSKAENEFKESLSVNAYNLKTVFQFTNETEKTDYIKNSLSDDEKVYSFYISEKLKSGHPYSLSLFHRNLILSASQALNKKLFSANDTAVIKKYNEWVRLRKLLSALYSKPIADRREEVGGIEERAGQLEKELTRYSASFKDLQSTPNITWQSIQQKLKEDEAAIEFLTFEYYDGKAWTGSVFYAAVILRKDKPEPGLISLFEKGQLDSVLNYKNTSAGQAQLSYLYSNRQENKTKSLYELIWRPIEKELEGIKTVYFAPAGLLHKIAFAALPVNDKEVLSDKYKLVQLNTTASVGDKSTDPIVADDKIILFGGVQYDADAASMHRATSQYSGNNPATRSLPDDLVRDGVADFYFLAGTEKEVDAISNLAGQNNYVVKRVEGLEATEESFKALAGKNSPAVLHIATHGFFFPDPKNIRRNDMIGGAQLFKQSDNPLIRSGLALSGANNAWKGKPLAGVEDGILTSYEVSNMYFPNTKLVVLSACETGLGDIQGSEGVYGLQRAFKMAGAQNLVMSLWKVDDIATSEFMQEFYRNLFSKKPISNAFYAAQTMLKNKYRNDPFKWAAWILVR